MYTITHIENNNLSFIELTSPDNASKASICLTQGGRLSTFLFNNIKLLADYKPSSYKNNYASSILFPFANRIKDGKYSFNNKNYQLECNEVDKNNALHGLVFNKTFSSIKKEITPNHASITIQYKNKGLNEGFPYKFNLQLTYTLNKNGLDLVAKIINEDQKSFPFTLGWHPYFLSSDLAKSSINFKSKLKYTFDEQQIITGTKDLDFSLPYNLKNTKLDDGYPLESNKVELITPEYSFKIKTSSKDTFLQVYTPEDTNVIAIEPMTGAADNFNNKIGLQILEPKNKYKVEWNLIIDPTKK